MGSLQSKIIVGDQEAFKEWMELHILAIERFCMQFGLTPQDAGKVAEKVFSDLYHDLSQVKEEQLEVNSIFKTVIQVIERLQVQSSETGLFPFEEDNELHAQLIGLPIEERIAFILFCLHEKSQEDIAWIMETPIVNVDDLLSKARMKLDGPDIEKRLEFLNRSFHRFRPSYNQRKIFNSTPKVAIPSGEPVKKAIRRRKPLLLWLVGSVIIILILSLTVLTSDAYQQSSDERFIERLVNSFQQELDDRFELIGLSETEKGRNSYTIVIHGYQYTVTEEEYGFETKYRFNGLIRDLENQLLVGKPINKKEAQKKYDELVLELRLPSEMLDNLQKNPLTNDREQSLAFLDELYKKNDFLGNAYYKIVGENAEKVLTSDLVNDGMVDIDKLLEHKSSFPIELQKAIDGMTTQYYSLTSIKDISPLTTKYGTPELEDKLRRNLHPDMQIYIALLTGDLIIHYTGTFEDHLEALLELEDALPKIKESDQMIDLFYSHYILMFITAAGFNNENGILDASGVVRDEIKYRWRRIASNGENSPTGQIMRQLIVDMAASNWKSSSYYEQLVDDGIWEELKKKMNEIRAIENE